MGVCNPMLFFTASEFDKQFQILVSKSSLLYFADFWDLVLKLFHSKCTLLDNHHTPVDKVLWKQYRKYKEWFQRSAVREEILNTYQKSFIHVKNNRTSAVLCHEREPVKLTNFCRLW